MMGRNIRSTEGTGSHPFRSRCAGLGIALALILALALAGCSVLAEGDRADGEAALRELLANRVGANRIAQMDYGDYDADGIYEAFALVSDQGLSPDGDGVTGEIWFVTPWRCEQVHAEDSYLSVGRIGVGPSLYKAEAWYGGSGSSSLVWGVNLNNCVALAGGDFEGITGGDVPNEFYMHPTDFDLFSDGTGHTWKRYYYYLDGLRLMEYGGLSISRAALEEVEGARAILASAEDEGWRVGEIFYRENGIINVNLQRGESNDNLTLRFDGRAVTDTGERYGGVYRAASGLTPATYPGGFEHEATAGDDAGRVAVSGTRETLRRGTREEILNARGALDVNSLVNVTRVATGVAEGAQRLRVYFKDGVYMGGSEGYWEDWLTASGAVSEACADLDGDGAREYVLLYLVSEEVSEYGYSHWQNSWTVAIYEPVGDAYELACEFPIDVPMDCERFVRLVPYGAATRIMTASAGYGDGGTGGLSVAMYSYDGTGASVDVVVHAAVGYDSCLAYGPLDPWDLKDINSALYSAYYDPAPLATYGLVEGENCFCFDYDYDRNGNVFDWEGGSSERVNLRAFEGFDRMAALAVERGVTIGYDISRGQDGEAASESYTLYVNSSGPMLLWAKETWDASDYSDCIDIVTHFEGSPFIDAMG